VRITANNQELKMGNKTTACITGVLALASSSVGHASVESGGFVEDSSLTLLSRNFYFNRDYRKGGESPTGKAGYAEAWAQAFIARFQSGYTEGTVGFGLDAYAMLALKLDSGDGRSGGRSSFDMLPVDSNGDTASNFSKLGGALKARLFDTEIKVGAFWRLPPAAGKLQRLDPGKHHPGGPHLAGRTPACHEPAAIEQQP
jgi:hypothetical protein